MRLVRNGYPPVVECELPEELWRELRHEAARLDRSLSWIFTSCIKRALRRPYLLEGDADYAPAPDAHVVQYLLRAAAEFPECCALICDGQRITYSELVERAWRVAAVLKAYGLLSGSRVGVLLPDRAEFVEVLFGTWLADMTVVPLQGWPSCQFDKYVRDADLSVLVTSGALRSLVLNALEQSTLPQRPRLHVVGDVHADAYRAGPREREDHALPSGAHASHPLLIQHAVDHVGRLDGVVFTNHQLLTHLEGSARWFATGEDDRVLCPHAYGTSISLVALLSCIRAGVTFIGQDSLDWHSTALQLTRERVTCVWASCSGLRRLVQQAANAAPLPCGLRRVVSVGPLRQDLIASVSQVFRAPVDVCWGPVEALHMAFVTRAANYKPGSLGLPHGAFEHKFIDVPRTSGRQAYAGPIAIRGPSLSTTYCCYPHRHFTDVEPDGFLVTSYIGYEDEDGTVFMIDRSDRVVARDETFISMLQVENCATLGTVREAWAIRGGVDFSDEKLLLVLEIHDRFTTDVEELHSALAANLPEAWLPDRYAFVAELPRTPSGQVRPRELARTRHRLQWQDAPHTAHNSRTNVLPSDARMADVSAEVLALAWRIIELVEKRGLQRRRESNVAGWPALCVTESVRVGSQRCRSALGYLVQLEGVEVSPCDAQVGDIVRVTVPA